MNKKGFSLIEVLVVIVILGILFTMGAFGLSNWIKKEQFRGEVSMIFDLFQEARTNALANKMCDGNIAEKWEIEIRNNEIQLKCVYKQTNNFIPPFKYFPLYELIATEKTQNRTNSTATLSFSTKKDSVLLYDSNSSLHFNSIFPLEFKEKNGTSVWEINISSPLGIPSLTKN